MAWYIDQWERRYPQTIAFLRDGFGAEAAVEQVWAAFLQVSTLPAEVATAAIAFVKDSTSPPLIWFTDLGTRSGEFSTDQPNRIQIATLLTEKFERAADRPEARRFFASKVLHEMVHWSLCSRKVTEQVEAGVAFEEAAYTPPLVSFWLDAASQDALRTEIAAPTPQFVDSARRKLEPGEFGNKDLTAALPRGIRNNNPGNIRRSKEQWQGLARPDELKSFQIGETAFCVFSDASFGIRAMARILNGYQVALHLRTVAGMINRWAPPSDNNATDRYVQTVCVGMGIGGNDPFNFGDPGLGSRMLGAMIKVENGMQPYSADLLMRGHAMATL